MSMVGAGWESESGGGGVGGVAALRGAGTCGDDDDDACASECGCAGAVEDDEEPCPFTCARVGGIWCWKWTELELELALDGTGGLYPIDVDPDGFRAIVGVDDVWDVKEPEEDIVGGVGEVAVGVVGRATASIVECDELSSNV